MSQRGTFLSQSSDLYHLGFGEFRPRCGLAPGSASFGIAVGGIGGACSEPQVPAPFVGDAIDLIRPDVVIPYAGAVADVATRDEHVAGVPDDLIVSRPDACRQPPRGTMCADAPSLNEERAVTVSRKFRLPLPANVGSNDLLPEALGGVTLSARALVIVPTTGRAKPSIPPFDFGSFCAERDLAPLASTLHGPWAVRLRTGPTTAPNGCSLGPCSSDGERRATVCALSGPRRRHCANIKRHHDLPSRCRGVRPVGVVSTYGVTCVNSTR